MKTTLVRLGTVAFLAVTAASMIASNLPVEPPRRLQDFKYTTMARCNTKDCHGSDTPKGSPALNEYVLWKSVDPHSKAFTTLYKGPSKAMGTAMGIAKVHESPKCLTCHSMVVKPEQVVPNVKWAVQNGVSCEVCHGPAEKWIDPHVTPKEKNWPHEKSVENGMIDLRSPLDWTRKCASCHLQIDHDMIAAGHPPLHFEIVDYNARTGAHWKTEKHPSMAADFDARIWTIGQAVSLVEALRNLQKHLKDGAPEELTKRAREQVDAYARLLKHVTGFTPQVDPAKLDEAIAAVETAAKGMAPADESILPKLAAEELPKDFAGARQLALAFKALSKKAEAKAAIDKLAEGVAAKHMKTFDPAKFAADFEAVKAIFK